MKKQILSKVALTSVISAAALTSASAHAASGGSGGTPMPAIDSVVTTTFDKSVINGSLAHDAAGNLLYDAAGNARFVYTGKIYAVETDNTTGELTKMSDDPIGEISGEAAFPKEFVALSTAVNGLMTQMNNATWDGNMPKFPAIVPWTCNHCDMTVGGKHYVSIVDVLTKGNKYYSQQMVDNFNAGVGGGAEAVLNETRMKGRAFTAVGPASFDPVSRTMGVRMAGCSALVNLTDMKIGTLCMNSTAVFNVSGTAPDTTGTNMYGYSESSQISAEGSSNCVTVMQPMQ